MKAKPDTYAPIPYIVGYHIELLCTVYYMMEVLQGHADSICMEPIDHASDFRLNYGNKKHFFDFKKAINWPLFTLYLGNLFNFQRNQSKGNNYYTIILLQQAKDFNNLVNLVKNTSGYDDFNKEILRDDLQHRLFKHLSPLLERPEDVYQALKRLDTKVVGTHLEKSTESRIELFIDGDPEVAKLALVDYAMRTAGSELTADDIWLFLEDSGFHPRGSIRLKARQNRLIRIGEIREFEAARNISRRDITSEILSQVRRLDEIEEIEPFLREILFDPNKTPHTSTERADILTAQVTYSNRAHLAAFVNKGKSCSKVTSKLVGHQVIKLRNIPLLDLIVLLAGGDIQDDIIGDVTYIAEVKEADYMIIDAIDMARLFIAYNKICSKDGIPYINGTCPKCGTSTNRH